MKNQINIRFKDNDVVLKFSLDNNTLFYGLNGRGKTRALKSIHLIHELASSTMTDDSISILEELNLSELNIFGKNYKSIFARKDAFLQEHIRLLNSFTEKNQDLLSEYSFLLTEYLNIFSNFLTSVDIRKLQNTIKILRSNKNFGFRIRNLNDFSSTLKFANLVIIRSSKQIQTTDNYSFQNFSNMINIHPLSESCVSIYKHIDSLIQNELYNQNSSLGENARIINQGAKSILNKLGQNTTLYVSADIEKEASSIFDKLRSRVKKINEEILKEFWKESNHSTLSDTGISGIYQLQNDIYLFNNVINKYENINLEIESDGIVSFKKNGHEIEFEKLSSGEKRLSIIFMNIIFVKKNIYLIDEPEMSLSLNYQSKILLDMLELVGENTLMIATHAPFIFEDFKEYEGSNIVEV